MDSSQPTVSAEPDATPASDLVAPALAEINLGLATTCNQACRFCSKRLEEMVLRMEDRRALRPYLRELLGLLPEEVDAALELLPSVHDHTRMDAWLCNGTCRNDLNFEEDPAGLLRSLRSAIASLRHGDRTTCTSMCAEALFCLREHIAAKSRPRLPVAKYMTVIRDAARLGAKVVNIAGPGDPLSAAPDVLAVMREAKNSGMCGCLISNAALLDESFAREIVAMRWDRFTVSLQSADPSVHDAITGVAGSLHASREGLRRLVAAKIAAGSEKPELRMNIVITKHNFRGFPDLLDMAVEAGISVLAFLPLLEIPFMSEWDRLAVPDGEAMELGTILTAVAEEGARRGVITNAAYLIAQKTYSSVLPVATVIGAAELTDKDEDEPAMGDVEEIPFHRAFCLFPWRSITVDPTGDIRACCLPLGTLDLGNLKRRSLEEIWTGPGYQALRKRMLAKRPPAECRVACAALWRYPSEEWRREALQACGITTPERG